MPPSISVLFEQAWPNHRDQSLSRRGGTPTTKEARSGKQGTPNLPKGDHRADLRMDQREPGLPQVDGKGYGQCKRAVVVAVHDHQSEKTLQILVRRRIAAGGMLKGKRRMTAYRQNPGARPDYPVVRTGWLRKAEPMQPACQASSTRIVEKLLRQPPRVAPTTRRPRVCRAM